MPLEDYFSVLERIINDIFSKRLFFLSLQQAHNYMVKEDAQNTDIISLHIFDMKRSICKTKRILLSGKQISVRMNCFNQ